MSSSPRASNRTTNSSTACAKISPTNCALAASANPRPFISGSVLSFQRGACRAARFATASSAWLSEQLSTCTPGRAGCRVFQQEGEVGSVIGNGAIPAAWGRDVHRGRDLGVEHHFVSVPFGHPLPGLQPSTRHLYYQAGWARRQTGRARRPRIGVGQIDPVAPSHLSDSNRFALHSGHAGAES